jgi:flavodoxin I
MVTGMFYGSTNGSTETVAETIRGYLGDAVSVYQNIGNTAPKDIEACDNLIFGISTWDVGLLQADWDVFWPKMDQLNLTGKKVAIFGLGDQVGYPDTYQDAVGILADKVVERGATVVGKTSPEGQTFEASKALKDGLFQGLCIDILNQDDQTASRIAAWVPQIQSELGLVA